MAAPRLQGVDRDRASVRSSGINSAANHVILLVFSGTRNWVTVQNVVGHRGHEVGGGPLTVPRAEGRRAVHGQRLSAIRTRAGSGRPGLQGRPGSMPAGSSPHVPPAPPPRAHRAGPERAAGHSRTTARSPHSSARRRPLPRRQPTPPPRTGGALRTTDADQAASEAALQREFRRLLQRGGLTRRTLADGRPTEASVGQGDSGKSPRPAGASLRT